MFSSIPPRLLDFPAESRFIREQCGMGAEPTLAPMTVLTRRNVHQPPEWDYTAGLAGFKSCSSCGMIRGRMCVHWSADNMWGEGGGRCRGVEGHSLSICYPVSNALPECVHAGLDGGLRSLSLPSHLSVTHQRTCRYLQARTGEEVSLLIKVAMRLVWKSAKIRGG